MSKVSRRHLVTGAAALLAPAVPAAVSGSPQTLPPKMILSSRSLSGLFI